MKFVGMLRVRNEARWIDRVLRSLQPLCEQIYVLDDHSTDETPDICQNVEGVTLFSSPYNSLDEARDKDYLLRQIRRDGAVDIVVAIDGDEVLEPGGQSKIMQAVLCGGDAWHMRVIYLWNDDLTVRTDGVYSRMSRPSMFRLRASRFGFKRTPYGRGANLHCSSVPMELLPRSIPTDIRLLHLGYRDRADRIRKYLWYNSIDPRNKLEDEYRHIVQGDVDNVPAGIKLRHAGPLELAPLQ